ncbi:unnamed protein product [Rhizoctonia solani]|uniref:Knr4/Smi1-like domain-containing protein n=1 Tax=Rhizoctonia solani TaxID=456999 RepID=A0A8H3A2G5_9AGAM|nr:unnamed protein product [Rhizoctonia solani]
MSNYFALRIAGAPKRILYAHSEHNAVEITAIVARDMALHGYLDESAMVIAPIWNSAVEGCRDFSLDFVRNTIFNFGLDLIWRGADFVPLGLDTWESTFDVFGYTNELIEAEQRTYFCLDSKVAYDSDLDGSFSHYSWSTIRSMLAVWEEPDTHILHLPPPNTELDALERLKAYIGQGLSSIPDVREYRPCILGLELSLKYGGPQLANEFLNTIVAQITSAGPLANPLIRDLALTPRIGYIVRKNSVLEHATGFVRSSAQAIAFETARALDSRFRWGEARPYASLSWATLLSEIEALESKARGEEHEPDLPFFHPPASSEQITQAEKNLGVTLPQDYKEFLMVSNGLGSFSRSDVTPLLSVEDIFWDTRYNGLKVEYRRFESNHLVSQLPCLHRVLQVADTDEDQYLDWWLIEPGLIEEAKRSVGEDGPAEWLGVTYAVWDPQLTHRGSFRMMMERRLAGLVKDEQI